MSRNKFSKEESKRIKFLLDECDKLMKDTNKILCEIIIDIKKINEKLNDCTNNYKSMHKPSMSL